MTILKRIWNWIRSLFSGKKQDEAKDLDRQVEKTWEMLRNMKAKTEAVLVEQEKRKREISQCKAELDKMNLYAEKAGEGSQDAICFQEKAEKLGKRLQELEQAEKLSGVYVTKATELYDSTRQRLQEVAEKRDVIQANSLSASLSESLRDLERQADKAEALAELDQGVTGHSSEMEQLMAKYDEQKQSETPKVQQR